MGSNKRNDAAIADDGWNGRTAPISARATAAAKETTKVLKIEKSVAPLESQLGRGGLPRHPVRDRIREFSPRIMEKWKEGGGLYMRERESSDLVLLKFGSIVFWEVGYVSLFRDSRMSYTDI